MERSLESANRLIASENVAEQLLAALRRQGLDITLEQLYESEIWNRTVDEYEHHSQPKRETLEALILCGGEDFLEDGHFVLACNSFPEEQIAMVEDPGGLDYARVSLCKQKLSFQPDCLPGLLLTSPSGKEERKHGSSTMSHVSCNVCLTWHQPCISHGVEGWKDVKGRVLTVCCE